MAVLPIAQKNLRTTNRSWRSDSVHTVLYTKAAIVPAEKWWPRKRSLFCRKMRGVPASTLREIAALGALGQRQHPNIIRLLDVVVGRQANIADSLVVFMIFEHIAQYLATYIANRPKPGLSSGTIKVATLWYRPPEVIIHLPYSTAIDMWSCGCIMAEMYLSASLYPGPSEIELFNKIFSVIGLPSEEKWPKDIPILRSSFEPYLATDFKTIIPQICSNGEDLLKKILEFDDSKRVIAFDALQYPYLDRIDG